MNDLKFPAIGQLCVTNSEGSGVGPNGDDAVDAVEDGAMRGRWGVAMAGCSEDWAALGAVENARAAGRILAGDKDSELLED